jgi:hypothetical protein
MLGPIFRRVSLLPLALPLLLAAGCASHGAPRQPSAIQLEIRPARIAAFSGGTPFRLARTGETLYLTPEVLATNADIREIAIGPGTPGHGYGVVVRFSDEAGTRLTAFSAQADGERLAVLLDHQLVMAPSVRTLLSRDVVLEANFSEEEARYLAGALGR